MRRNLMSRKMRKLTKLQSVIFLVGGVLMVIGAGCFAVMWYQHIVCWLFLVGALIFTVMQSMQTYEGNLFTVKRLKRIQAVANIFFLIAGVLMVDTVYHFFLSLFQDAGSNGYQNYLAYVYNKWVVFLLVAAILQLYTIHRIGTELQKEKKL